jgi:hypothetical protein
MLQFKPVIEEFSATLDALRDFVTSVGPVLLQRQEQAHKEAGPAMARLYVASLLAADNLEAMDLAEETKSVMVEFNKVIRAATNELAPDKVAGLRETALKGIPVKFVAGRFEIDTDNPATRNAIARHQMTQKIQKELALLHESTLMALVSRSEWFIAQLVHLFFGRYPEAAGTSEPFFSLAKLSSLQSIEEAREVLVEHKVESLMRQSFEDWLQFFKQKPKIKMSYLETTAARISEIFKRRNLLVHNGGRVARIYFESVHESLRPGLSLGDIVEITPEYLSGAIDLIEEQFVLISAELWKKLEPDVAERCDLLQRLCVEKLKEKRWEMARSFAYFGINDKGALEASRLSAQVNYWQSFKWSGRYEEIRAEVEQYDISAKSLLYQAACAAIRNDFECLFKLIPKALEDRCLTKDNLAQWPLFQAARERPEFAQYVQKDEPESLEPPPSSEVVN